jgi:diguanylate cyclase (GGDEF)-like protein
MRSTFVNELVDLDGDAAPRQRRTARTVVLATVVASLAALPFAATPVAIVPVAFPMIGAIAATAQALTAAMLYSRFRSTSLPSISILVALYATAALTSLGFLLWLPGSAEPGTAVTATATFGGWAFGIGCLLFVAQLAAYSAADDAERRNRDATARTIRNRILLASGSIVLVGALLVPGPAAGNSLEPLRRFVLVPLLLAGLAANLGILGVVFRRRATMVRLWLGVVTIATFVEVSLSQEIAGPRSGIAWLVVLAAWLAASSVFLVAMVANVYETLSMLSLRNEALYEQSVSDELTGLLNRRGFNTRLEEQFRRSARAEEALAVLLIDIDDFKRYNDTYGHQGGDRAIASVARVVGSMLRRAGDAGARIGGDEFAVLLPKTDMAGAVGVAERIRAAVERLALKGGEGSRHPVVTVTIGVTSVGLSGGPPPESNVALETGVLLGRADAALYAAKDAGRNCVRYRQLPFTPLAATDLEPDPLR